MKARIDYRMSRKRSPDVSARALHPQLRPGGIAGPPGEDARLADQWCLIASICIRKTPAPSAKPSTDSSCWTHEGSGVFMSEC